MYHVSTHHVMYGIRKDPSTHWFAHMALCCLRGWATCVVAKQLADTEGCVFEYRRYLFCKMKQSHRRIRRLSIALSGDEAIASPNYSKYGGYEEAISSPNKHCRDIILQNNVSAHRKIMSLILHTASPVSFITATIFALLQQSLHSTNTRIDTATIFAFYCNTLCTT